VDKVQLSADDLARLNQEPASGFGIQDGARLRFLKAWDATGLKVEVIGDLIARGELPFSFVDAPTTWLSSSCSSNWSPRRLDRQRRRPPVRPRRARGDPGQPARRRPHRPTRSPGTGRGGRAQGRRPTPPGVAVVRL